MRGRGMHKKVSNLHSAENWLCSYQTDRTALRFFGHGTGRRPRKGFEDMSTALLIIDMQNDYFPGGKFELWNPFPALDAAEKLLRCFREEKRPVYHVQHISGGKAAFFIPDTDGVKIHPKLAPLDTECVVVKHAPSSFFRTELQAELRRASVTELVVCGMMTHMCVDTTVRAARDYGYSVTLISDACAARDLEWAGRKLPADVVQAVYFASLNRSFAHVMTSAEYLEQLRTPR